MPDSIQLKQNFWEHLHELRKALFQSVMLIVVSASIVHYFREPVVTTLLGPLGKNFTSLQFLSPLDPLFFILKVDFTLGLLAALPIISVIIWKFLAPATTIPTWKALLFMSVTAILGTVGTLYAYYFVVPTVLSFMSIIVIEGTVTSYTAHGYLNFLLSISTLLILVFEIPLIIFLCTILGIVHPNTIAKKRSSIYVAILIISAVITPTTDIITLALVCLPAIAATELGVLFARLFVAKES